MSAERTGSPNSSLPTSRQDHQAPLWMGLAPPDQLCCLVRAWQSLCLREVLLPARPIRADSAHSCIFGPHSACLDYACTPLPGLAQLLGTPPCTLQVKLMTCRKQSSELFFEEKNPPKQTKTPHTWYFEQKEQRKLWEVRAYCYP